MREDYEERQRAMDRAYEKAAADFVKDASPEEIQKFLAAGVIREVKVKGGGVSYVLADTDREPMSSSGTIVLGSAVDAAQMCDSRVDLASSADVVGRCDGLSDDLAEKFGLDDATAMKIADFIQAKLARAEGEVMAVTLSRIVGVLIQSTTNQQARAHALMHAVPGMAALNGYPSLRKSAAKCGCSVEWVSRMRSDWCNELGIPIPIESSKSDEARAKYSQLGTTNHWRTRTCSKPHKTATKTKAK